MLPLVRRISPLGVLSIEMIFEPESYDSHEDSNTVVRYLLSI